MCNCIAEINNALETQALNTRLDIPIVLNFQTGQQRPPMVKIAVYKYDSKRRERAMPVFPIYCPFCGEKYPAEVSVGE